MCVLVFERRDVAEALMQADGVVPADVLDDGELELRSRRRRVDVATDTGNPLDVSGHAFTERLTFGAVDV